MEYGPVLVNDMQTPPTFHSKGDKLSFWSKKLHNILKRMQKQFQRVYVIRGAEKSPMDKSTKATKTEVF